MLKRVALMIKVNFIKVILLTMLKKVLLIYNLISNLKGLDKFGD
jgi:hypothetical protein